MKFSPITAALAALATPAHSVLYGDEWVQDSQGKFWAFYSGGVAIIDPESCTVEETITQDNEMANLPAGWSDGVYMQPKDSDDQYILMNSRINRENVAGDSVSDVYIFDTKEREVIAKVETGPRIVHSYGVWTKDEFWTHSDGDGHFYVIDLEDIKNDSTTVGAKVKAHDERPFHGKLMWNEDGMLVNRGFATATGEQFLFELDIETDQFTDQYDFSMDVKPGTCSGLHAIAYSSINNHIYTECSGGGGILEFNVEGLGIQFVHQHLSMTGSLYEVPDGSYVIATNKGGNKLHVFKPNGNGMQSSLAYDVEVPGYPSTPQFYPLDNVDGGADYMACMPLTSNPNQNHIDPESNDVMCSYYNGCTGAQTLADIDRGICYHDETMSSPKDLMRVSSIMVATDDALCQRCMEQGNYEDGMCTCTPNCGYCDTNFETDLSKSGVACVDLGKVVDGTVSSATLIEDAGGVKQGRGYSSSNECAFGRTYRSHKRGMKWDASISNYPRDSVVIVDMSTQEVACQVDVPGAPGRIVWAPNNSVPRPQNQLVLCFSGESTVNVFDKGATQMKDLNIGDKVKVSNGKYETIYSFGHKNAKTMGEFVQLRTEKSKIELSKDHMIFSQGKALPAGAMKIGDILDLSDGDSAKVTDINIVKRQGAFAPFTTSGVISVNGMLASSYVNMQGGESDKVIIGGVEIFSMQSLAQMFEAPHRLACAVNFGLCERESYNKDGVSTWVVAGHTGANWLLKQNSFVMAAVLAPVATVFFAISAIEYILQNVVVSMMIVASVYFASRKMKTAA